MPWEDPAAAFTGAPAKSPPPPRLTKEEPSSTLPQQELVCHKNAMDVHVAAHYTKDMTDEIGHVYMHSYQMHFDVFWISIYLEDCWTCDLVPDLIAGRRRRSLGRIHGQ